MRILASTRDLPDPVPCPECGEPSRISTGGGPCLGCLMQSESEAQSRARMLGRMLLCLTLLGGSVAVCFAPLVWRALTGGAQ